MGRLGRGIEGRLLYWRDLKRYRALADPARYPITGRWPIHRDRFRTAGELGEYFHQDLWAARKLHAALPRRHVDVGSRIDGFVAHCLVFMDVEVVDIRPLAHPPKGLRFIQADAQRMADFADGSIPSLSSLHAAEHFGLGRYGDAVDPEGHITFMRALARVLAPGGRLYFSVPVGRAQRVEFNAHRVLRAATVLEVFGALQLRSFSLVRADGTMLEDVTPAAADEVDYGCGLFEFSKP